MKIKDLITWLKESTTFRKSVKIDHGSSTWLDGSWHEAGTWSGEGGDWGNVKW